MMALADHLLAAPIVLPLATGAIATLTGRRFPRATAALSLAATLGFIALAVLLVRRADEGAVHAYLVGNWLAPFGIALALDRLAALMLLLTGAVALLSLLYALGGDDRRGLHFHALFQFLLMGLAGAFLTADLFNLFVFFEVLLVASYGLALHGAGRGGLKSTMHYIVFNLSGSALFLVAVSLLYGVTGTLNMAHLSTRLLDLPPESAVLAQAAALLLLTVFGVKAALLPLYFWLPTAYASASAPVAALFAIMTKVGVYAIARTTTLMFSDGAAAQVFDPWLLALALATLVLAAQGALGALHLRRLVAYLVVASAGTLLLAVGLHTPEALAAGLFYLVNSTLAAALWFLIADRIAAARAHGDALREPCAITPSQWVALGIAFFIAAVAAAGMPPLAGFIGKAWLLQAAGNTPWAAGIVAVVLGSSLALIVALARAGSGLFWRPGAPGSPAATSASAHPMHGAAIALGLALPIATTLAAGPLSAYTQAAAAQLFDRQAYVRAVLGAPVAPPAWDIRREMRDRGELKQ